MPLISIKAEPVFHLLGFPVNNSLITALIGLSLFLIIAIYFNAQSKKTQKGRFYYLIKFFVKSIYNLFYSVFKEKTYIFFPVLFTFFIYILIQNWFELIPGVGSILIKTHEAGKTVMVPILRGNSTDLNSTISLALISFFLIQYYSIKFLGIKGFLRRFIKLANPIMFFIGILDIISEISKIISFAFRLFGNMFAGEVLLLITAFLVPILGSFPFWGLELFVGFIQALVFSMLTAVFISGAIEEHH